MKKLLLSPLFLLRRLLWLALFIALFAFSWKNTAPLSLHVWRNTDIEAPTIVILLLTFFAGWICHALLAAWLRRSQSKHAQP